MTAESTEKRFVKRMRELLVSLPYDMKVLFEAMSDENLSTDARQLAASAAIYCLSPSDRIPDSMGLLGYVDDVVFLRLAYQRLVALAGEDAARYRNRFPDEFKSLESDLELMRQYLGNAFEWVRERTEKAMPKARYKGKAATTYVEDDEAREFLYEEGQNFITQYDIDEEAAARLQSGRPILDAFRKRMAEELRWIG
jgi:uncharacterized membrane protein YkvA (DUF1232 family)